MKEAAGEANLTVVAIILIAVVVAVATPLVGSLMKNASKRSCCADAGGGVQSGPGRVLGLRRHQRRLYHAQGRGPSHRHQPHPGAAAQHPRRRGAGQKNPRRGRAERRGLQY